ncbi:MAG: hypothetical protein R6W96_00815 [Clostridia bacterium]
MEKQYDLRRKFIPVLAMTGSLCGFFMMLFHMVDKDVNVVLQSLIFIGYLVAGTLASHLIRLTRGKKGIDVINRNEKDEAYLIKQKMYLLAIPVFILAFLFTQSMGILYALVYSFAYGTAFLLGISNGLFDYKDMVTTNLLYVGVIPIGFSFVYAYYGANIPLTSNTAWFFGSMYLLAYLLLINRMKLNSILFFRSSVNVENSRKIRIQNDILIGLFYLLYLVIFNFRQLINFSYDILLTVFTYFLIAMQAIMDFLLADTRGGDVPGDPTGGLDAFEPVEMAPWLTYLLYGLLIVAFAIGLVFFIILLVRIIRKIVRLIMQTVSGEMNRKSSKKTVVAREYEEESVIIRKGKTQHPLQKKRRFHYTLKELTLMQNPTDKLRYFYAFVLERFRYKKVDFRDSDAPEEILEKISAYEGVDQLRADGFPEVTTEYLRVRYGEKEPGLQVDEEKARRYEKDIQLIKTDKK